MTMMFHEVKELVSLFLMVNILWRTCSAMLDWTTCEQMAGCSCKWVNGRKEAKCDNATLNKIPAVSHDIQAMVLDNNQIRILRDHIFKELNLVNLQTLSIKGNELEVIEKYALSNLFILFSIDLSYNQICKLDPKTFSWTEKLRYLNLNNNKIEKIEDDTFSNLDFLQTVELENNRIEHIGTKAFVNLKVLHILKLSGNRLKHVKLSIFESMNGLNSLDLKNNPWKCDCHLREFVEWCNKRNLYSQPTTCSEPHNLTGMSWNNVTMNSFACMPEITMVEYRIDNDEERLLLSCKVRSDPKPETYWTFNSRTLNNNTVQGTQGRKYVNYESDEYGYYWYNVSVQKLIRQDYGVYICVSRNAAGVVERNVTISEDQSFFPFPQTSGGNVWLLLLCLLIGLICALILIFMLCFLCCRRMDHTIASKKPANIVATSNGDVSHHIVIEPEQQKTLLTSVNPVQKPPRRYDSSPKSEHDGTELTELNRNLLDDSSIKGASVAGDSMEDRRSTNSLEQLSCSSQDNLIQQERVRPVPMRAHCPPDLLAFSNRRHQTASPASSCVSNDTEVSHFHTLHPPVRSPIYQVRLYTPSYEALSYSRTHSPFSPTCLTQVVTQRQGYVTIPRRPRVPSWSSAPTAAIEDSLTTKTEPVYDNLGPRTTADGSSVISLPRKVSAETPSGSTSVASSSPYTSHTLPHKSRLNHVYLSIRENEEPTFHPVKKTSGVIRPLPLQFTPIRDQSSVGSDTRRASWATKPSTQPLESGILIKSGSETLSNGGAGGATSTPSTKPKVPPKPPPKPKKNGPLFEDEGEDGTEV